MTAARWGRWTSSMGLTAVAAVLMLLTTSCGKDTVSSAPGPGQASGGTPAGAPCPTKPLGFAPPSAWEAIGQRPIDAAFSPQPIFEAKLRITNPNSVDLTVRAKALVEAADGSGRSVTDYASRKTSYGGQAFATFAVPRPAGGNRLDGEDIAIQDATSIVLPAGGSIELVARLSTVIQAGAITTKVVYGEGKLAADTTAEIERCKIAIDGAEPISLLGGG